MSLRIIKIRRNASLPYRVDQKRSRSQTLSFYWKHALALGIVVAVMIVLLVQSVHVSSPKPTAKHEPSGRVQAANSTAVTGQSDVQPQASGARLTIPKLGVEAKVQEVGINNKDGTMKAPGNGQDVGWYKLGPVPGQQGNAVIDGHINTDQGKAVFANLNKLKPGDTFSVTDKKGKVSTFKVTRTQLFDTASAPLNDIFGPTKGTHLNLITCGGVWNKQQRDYSQRLVVFSDLLS